jgi:hypothetical protein
MKNIIVPLITPTIRGIIQTICGANVVDDDMMTKTISVVVFFGTLAWSAYEKHRIKSKSSGEFNTP